MTGPEHYAEAERQRGHANDEEFGSRSHKAFMRRVSGRLTAIGRRRS